MNNVAKKDEGNLPTSSGLSMSVVECDLDVFLKCILDSREVRIYYEPERNDLKK